MEPNVFNTPLTKDVIHDLEVRLSASCDPEDERMYRLMNFQVNEKKGTPQHEIKLRELTHLITEASVEQPNQTRFIMGIKIAGAGEKTPSVDDQKKIMHHLNTLMPGSAPILLEHFYPKVTYDEWKIRYKQIFGRAGIPLCPDHMCRHARRLFKGEKNEKFK